MRCVWKGGPNDGNPIDIPDERGILVALAPNILGMAEPDDPFSIETVFVPLIRTKTRNYLDWNKRTPA